ncbi:serine hydrolase domain-containing protein [Nocardioides albus]|uniref:CubicO group peptidase (Beta-lactamase class C family) n=1 Tax=Nocardioides albus TaxID=1841 RepID=A0A7W5A083_9ACTN|nr:serine hydrolase domain-containing protein [Nocardioides albus]MBB3087271.1 CubicO group peptidase (beta-lactamase class C family) [Nocardioides albus]GGU07835.1 serine hydrolase [Nocardioides albus]
MPRVHILLSLTALVLVLASLTSAGPATARPAAQATALDTERIDDFVESYLDRHGLPGAEIAVVHDGELVHERGFGETSDGQQVTPSTKMRIASVSKSITAFAVLQLVDQGEVELDQPVKRYLPEFEMADVRATEITVRQLLSHTSGHVTPTIIPPADTLKEGVTRQREWALAADPGSGYRYSNGNFWTAARLVEVVSGTGFDDYLRTNVFEPLRMDDTLSTTTSNEHVAGLADGHVLAYGRGWKWPEMEAMVAGAGGVVTTAHDMAQWLAMQQRGGVGPDGRRLLSADLVRESHTVQPGGGSARAGLGWVGSAAGVEPARLGHGGTDVTVSAQQHLVPSSGYGVMVILNSSTIVTGHPWNISGGIIEITEGHEPGTRAPVAILVDLGLGLLTILAVGLGVLGLRRAPGWAKRRAAWPWWRYVLRLVPQLIAPAVVVLLFGVATTLQDNSAVPADVFGLHPAAMILLLTGAAVGIALVVARLMGRRTSRPASPPNQEAHAR